MPGKIDIYNLGEHGVDTVKSPLHQSDGDLIQAQNAMPDPAGLEAGVRKRDGMAKINSGGALTGTVEGLINVPLPDIGRTYYVGQGKLPGGSTPATPWYSSPDGITWTGETEPAAGQHNHDLYTTIAESVRIQACVSYRRRLFYAGEYSGGVDNPVIRVWDGVADTELCRIPNLPGVSSVVVTVKSMFMHRGRIHALLNADVNAYAVYAIDPITGEIEFVGRLPVGVGHGVFGLSYQDRIWISSQSNGSGPKMYWLRNGDSAMTLDHTGDVNDTEFIHGCVYGGALYVGVLALANPASVLKRAADGTWTTSLTAAAEAAYDSYSGFVVFDGDLYCVYRNFTAAGVPSIVVKKFDGSSWTDDLNVLGAGYRNAPVGGVHADENGLLITFVTLDGATPDGYVLRRTTGGVWSKVLDLAEGNGMIGFL